MIRQPNSLQSLCRIISTKSANTKFSFQALLRCQLHASHSFRSLNTCGMRKCITTLASLRNTLNYFKVTGNGFLCSTVSTNDFLPNSSGSQRQRLSIRTFCHDSQQSKGKSLFGRANKANLYNKCRYVVSSERYMPDSNNLKKWRIGQIPYL